MSWGKIVGHREVVQQDILLVGMVHVLFEHDPSSDNGRRAPTARLLLAMGKLVRYSIGSHLNKVWEIDKQ